MLHSENSECKLCVKSAAGGGVVVVEGEAEATEKFRNSLAIMLIGVVY